MSLDCAYFKMVGKKVEGSVLSEVFLKAGLITYGSVHGLFSETHYKRAMHCHKVLLGSL